MSAEQYRMVQEGESAFYVVHFDGVMFLNGHDPVDNSAIWSDNLQDAAIYCQESAQMMALRYYESTFDPITVDVDLIA